MTTPAARARATRIYVAATLLLLLITALATLTLGKLGIPFHDIPAAFLGETQGKTAFVFEKLRGPRLATALCAGALLGISGALFQSVTHNPLGSPDVIGLGAGAGAGAAISVLAFPTLPTAFGAIAGAGLATLLVFISTGRGFTSPHRTIIAGISVAALAYAITEYVVSTQLRESASQLAAYLVGSLNASNIQDITIGVCALAVVLPASLALSTNATFLNMGDHAAQSVGVDPARTRTYAILLSVIAAGSAVAIAGPIAFIALAAPHIARKATKTSHINVCTSGLTGALLLTFADLVAQHFPPLKGLPVGVITLGIGGAYLGYLLIHEQAKGKI
ncbi:FecCD family ABC transporter permease [Timonella sp. A28]|uniref:FecCD family ABC transporter permease n=1 Tax=Timonella sp. A28 TaxID=3442640 RepID=UPI003EBD2561